MMMNFTLEELNKLAQMLDLATKAGGLAVAQDALPLFTKMQQMAQALQAADSTRRAANIPD